MKYRQKIDHQSLLQLFKQWHLIIPKRPLTLFAFRGLVPESPIHTTRKTWWLIPKTVDYQHMRCCVGIWNTLTGDVFLAPGSTVPHLSQVMAAIQKAGKGANQQEPGFYHDYQKGIHAEQSKNGHRALRQTANRFIRRTLTSVPYTHKDSLFYSKPYDNLHCGWQMDPNQSGFSSAGCVVVSGHAYAPRHTPPKPNKGYWKIFYDILYNSSQRKFSLLLLERHQIQRSLHTFKSSIHLCFGSTGPYVKNLQAFLKTQNVYKGPISGTLDARTYRAWNQLQFKVPFSK